MVSRESFREPPSDSNPWLRNTHINHDSNFDAFAHTNYYRNPNAYAYTNSDYTSFANANRYINPNLVCSDRRLWDGGGC